MFGWDILTSPTNIILENYIMYRWMYCHFIYPLIMNIWLRICAILFKCKSCGYGGCLIINNWLRMCTILFKYTFCGGRGWFLWRFTSHTKGMVYEINIKSWDYSLLIFFQSLPIWHCVIFVFIKINLKD